MPNYVPFLQHSQKADMYSLSLMVTRHFFCWQIMIGFRDRFRVVILKLNSKKYIDGVLKSKVNFEFLVNLFVSENDRIH